MKGLLVKGLGSLTTKWGICHTFGMNDKANK